MIAIVFFLFILSTPQWSLPSPEEVLPLTAFGVGTMLRIGPGCHMGDVECGVTMVITGQFEEGAGRG